MLRTDITLKMKELLSSASDETRLKIMYFLLSGEKCVNDIVVEVGSSQSLISHQLAYLRKKRLVINRKVGKNVFYSLSDDHVAKLIKVVYEHALEALNDEKDL